MLTQLSTVKARLEITASTYDNLLTNAIKGVSARFDRECNRTLAWGVDITQEFNAAQTEVAVAQYPIGVITSFALKTTEDESWVYQEWDTFQYLIRNKCIISLNRPLGTWRQQGQVTYSGGYVLPGDTPEPWQSALPDDLEQAAVEQCAAWFLNRDKVGLEVNWPTGSYQRLSQLPLLPSVEATLKRYRRWTI